MGNIKALTNNYFNLRSQRISAERHVRDMEKREQVAANNLAIEEAHRNGIEIGRDVAIYPSDAVGRLAVRCVDIQGFGPGRYNLVVALPKADGSPGNRRRTYRNDEVEAINAKS
jgi:hypothetical protein